MLGIDSYPLQSLPIHQSGVFALIPNDNPRLEVLQVNVFGALDLEHI